MYLTYQGTYSSSIYTYICIHISILLKYRLHRSVGTLGRQFSRGGILIFFFFFFLFRVRVQPNLRREIHAEAVGIYHPSSLKPLPWEQHSNFGLLNGAPVYIPFSFPDRIHTQYSIYSDHSGPCSLAPDVSPVLSPGWRFVYSAPETPRLSTGLTSM